MEEEKRKDKKDLFRMHQLELIHYNRKLYTWKYEQEKYSVYLKFYVGKVKVDIIFKYVGKCWYE